MNGKRFQWFDAVSLAGVCFVVAAGFSICVPAGLVVTGAMLLVVGIGAARIARAKEWAQLTGRD